MTRTEHVLAALGLEVAWRRGRRAWLLCPFHDDRRPNSFFVRVDGKRAGQNHCFSCKRGGGLRELVMHVRGCDEAQAKAFIDASVRSYEPPRVRARVVARPAQLGRARFRLPREVIVEPLAQWVSPALRYAQSRGLTEEEVATFGVGYAVDGRLAGRIVIPWLGAGRVVAGYSARSFVGDEPKYTTPHPSEKPDASVMVGEHLWPPHGQRDLVVVTEGALNALAARRALGDGAAYAALGGSELNPMHVAKLATFARVLLLTDPDAAGDKAAAAIARRLERYAATTRARLREGTDAQDYARDELRARLLAALPAGASRAIMG